MVDPGLMLSKTSGNALNAREAALGIRTTGGASHR